MAKPENVLTSMRLPSDLLKRARALVPALQNDPTVGAMGLVSRSKVLTLALVRGLADLEREYGKPKGSAKR